MAITRVMTSIEVLAFLLLLLLLFTSSHRPGRILHIFIFLLPCPGKLFLIINLIYDFALQKQKGLLGNRGSIFYSYLVQNLGLHKPSHPCTSPYFILKCKNFALRLFWATEDFVPESLLPASGSAAFHTLHCTGLKSSSTPCSCTCQHHPLSKCS